MTQRYDESMNFVTSVKLGLTNPPLLGRKISQFYNRVRTSSDYNPVGIDIFEEDWDNLIILDACRYDVFEEVHDLDGTLRPVISRGAATPEFLNGNFRDRTLHDTVYVTTNPMLERHSDEINVSFHDCINLWAGETWNEELGTVLPEVVTEEAKRAHEQYPNKRLLVHYMQPHYPFISSDTTFDKGHIAPDSPDELTTWMQVMTGEVDVDPEYLWDAYVENLRSALPHVEELVDALPGKTVVTSDHGNMFGERSSPIPIREWGHPPNIWTDELVKVPWLEISGDDRKNIKSEAPVVSANQDLSETRERLESLGYV